MVRNRSGEETRTEADARRTRCTTLIILLIRNTANAADNRAPRSSRRRAPSEDIRASTRTVRVCLRTHDASLRSARRRRVGPRVRPPLVAPSPLVFVHALGEASAEKFDERDDRRGEVGAEDDARDDEPHEAAAPAAAARGERPRARRRGAVSRRAGARTRRRSSGGAARVVARRRALARFLARGAPSRGPRARGGPPADLALVRELAPREPDPGRGQARRLRLVELHDLHHRRGAGGAAPPRETSEASARSRRGKTRTRRGVRRGATGGKFRARPGDLS